MSRQKTIQKKKQKEIIMLTLKERIAALVKLFRQHKSRQKAVTSKKIFESLYGSIDNYEDLQVYFLWQQIKQAMNATRKSTYCFIVSEKVGAVWKYYVPTDYEEIEPYVTLLRKTQKKIDFMIARGKTSIRKKYYERI